MDHTIQVHLVPVVRVTEPGKVVAVHPMSGSPIPTLLTELLLPRVVVVLLQTAQVDTAV